MEQGNDRPAGSEARALAAYLTALRGVMSEAAAARRDWIRQVGVLLRDARIKPPEMVAPAAVEAGEMQRELFAGLRGRLGQLEPPEECRVCHAHAADWLDALVQACVVMSACTIATIDDTLRTTQRLIADSRTAFARCNAEYGRLVEGLRGRIEALRAARKPRRWPFGRAARER